MIGEVIQDYTLCDRQVLTTVDATTSFVHVAAGDREAIEHDVVEGRIVAVVDVQHAAAVAEAGRMRELLDRHLAKEDTGVVERGVRIDPNIADRLRAMGYLRYYPSNERL